MTMTPNQLEELAEGGKQCLPSIQSQIDKVKEQWTPHSTADLLPMLYVKSMVFLEIVSYQDDAFIDSLFESIRLAPASEKTSLRTRAKALAKWFSEEGHAKKNAGDISEDEARSLQDCFRLINLEGPFLPIESFNDKPSQKILRKYYPSCEGNVVKPNNLIEKEKRIWMNLAKSFRVSRTLSSDWDAKRQYQQSWQKVAVYSRIRQLSFDNHELDLLCYRLSVANALDLRLASNESFDRTAIANADRIVEIRKDMATNEKEMVDLDKCLAKLEFSWA